MLIMYPELQHSKKQKHSYEPKPGKERHPTYNLLVNFKLFAGSAKKFTIAHTIFGFEHQLPTPDPPS